MPGCGQALQKFNLLRIALQPWAVTYTVPPRAGKRVGEDTSERDKDMDMEKLLTREKADAICEKIATGLEENKIVGSANVIAYAMKEWWFAGFEEGRKYPLQESK
jgi:hypothetical protein